MSSNGGIGTMTLLPMMIAIIVLMFSLTKKIDGFKINLENLERRTTLVERKIDKLYLIEEDYENSLKEIDKLKQGRFEK